MPTAPSSFPRDPCSSWQANQGLRGSTTYRTGSATSYARHPDPKRGRERMSCGGKGSGVCRSLCGACARRGGAGVPSQRLATTRAPRFRPRARRCKRPAKEEPRRPTPHRPPNSSAWYVPFLSRASIPPGPTYLYSPSLSLPPSLSLSHSVRRSLMRVLTLSPALPSHAPFRNAVLALDALALMHAYAYVCVCVCVACALGV